MNRINISFEEKNNFVVKEKSVQYFSTDLELFKKHFPTHRLNNELARANSFTYERLDGQMIYSLLDVVSKDAILKNRGIEVSEKPKNPKTPKKSHSGAKVPPVKKAKPKSAKTDVKEELHALKTRISALEESAEVSEEDISFLRDEIDNKDASIEDLQKKIETLEAKAFSKKKASKSNFPE
ncbi:MAG: hypothetical protein LBG15_07890 [Dysgonamonadaceae bacterium]|jgi:hypothetical protein|nr:hypothetical protein [Dysgonamonadaceae bacterium]